MRQALGGPGKAQTDPGLEFPGESAWHLQLSVTSFLGTQLHSTQSRADGGEAKGLSELPLPREVRSNILLQA